MSHNFGLIIEEKKVEDYIAGFGSPVAKQVLFADGQVPIDYLPEGEIQKNNLIDYMHCVSESATNCGEILLMAKFNRRLNFSERFLAKVSGTTPQGNSQRNVAEAFRKQGGIEESIWAKGINMTWAQYYCSIPYKILKLALEFLNGYTINWEWINTDKASLKEALKYGPLQVIGFAWSSDNGIYKDYNNQANHAFCLIGYKENEYWLAYDSYPTDFQIDNNSTKQEFIKKLDWNFKFPDAIQYSIKINIEEKQTLINKLKNMFKKIARASTGALWFIKDGKKQEITDWKSFAGAVIDEVGVMQNNLTPDQLNKYQNNKFFG